MGQHSSSPSSDASAAEPANYRKLEEAVLSLSQFFDNLSTNSNTSLVYELLDNLSIPVTESDRLLNEIDSASCLGGVSDSDLQTRLPQMLRLVADVLTTVNEEDEDSDHRLAGVYCLCCFTLALIRHFRARPNGCVELVYLLDHAELVPPIEEDNPLPEGTFTLCYPGTRHRAFQVPSTSSGAALLRDNIVRWLQSVAPQHLWTSLLGDCVFRDLSTNEFVSLPEVERRACKAGSKHFALVPVLCRFENEEKQYTPVQKFYVRVMHFLAQTQRGLLLAATREHLLRIHSVLLESILTLIATIHSKPINSPVWWQMEDTASSDTAATGTAASGTPASSMTTHLADGLKSFREFFWSCTEDVAITAPFFVTFLGFFTRGDTKALSMGFCRSLVNGLWITDHPYLRHQLAEDIFHNPMSNRSETTASDESAAAAKRPIVQQNFESLTSRANAHTAEAAGTDLLAPVDDDPLVQRYATANSGVLGVLVYHPTTSLEGQAPFSTYLDLSECTPSNRAVIRRTTEPEKAPPNFIVANTFSQLLAELTDVQHFASEESANKPAKQHDGSIPLSFDYLLASFCSPERLKQRLQSLHLYTLIYRSRSFRHFVMSRTGAGLLVVAILKLLNDLCEQLLQEQKKQQQQLAGTMSPISSTIDDSSGTAPKNWIPLPPAVTLLSLTLLVLTRDTPFSVSLFRAMLPQPAPQWLSTGSSAFYQQLKHQPTSKQLSQHTQLSVGAVAVLVITRLVAVNIAITRETFGHELFDGLLTNLAPACENLHWLVSERVISLTLRLVRQCLRRLPEIGEVDQTSDPESDFLINPSPKVKPPPMTPYDLLRVDAEQATVERQLRNLQSAASPASANKTETPVEGTPPQHPLVISPPDYKLPCLKVGDMDPDSWADLKCVYHGLRGVLLLLSLSLLPVKTKAQEENPPALRNVAILYAFLRCESLSTTLTDLLRVTYRLAAFRKECRYAVEYWKSYAAQRDEWESYREARLRGDTIDNVPPVVKGFETWDPEQLPQIEPVDVKHMTSFFSEDQEKGEALAALMLQLSPHAQALLDLNKILTDTAEGEDGTEEPLGVDEFLAKITDKAASIFNELQPVEGTKPTTPLQRIQFYALSMTPALRSGFRESTSSEYFLPLVWKSLGPGC